MRILLDECIPRKLKYSLPDHECDTVPESGFAGKKNGALLGLAESAGLEIFVTMDKGSVVVLPHPDGPTSEKKLPRGMASEISRTACWPGKCFTSLRSSRMGAIEY